MSKASSGNSKEIESKADLIEWFKGWCTPADKLLIGVEHEKPPFYLKGNEPVPYYDENGKRGLRSFFEKMVIDQGWIPGYEKDKVIELRKDNVNWSLEPGGQMETGGAPLKNVHQNARETDERIDEAVEVAKSLGFGMLATGYHPTHTASEMPTVPKSRYEALRNCIQAQDPPRTMNGASCTATVQVNLGYTSEEDMVKMLRVALSLQPIAVALFANSPFNEGQPSGYQSYRSEVIHNYIDQRYGFMLPVAFEEDFGFEKFVDYAMNMPMLGLYDENGMFIDVKGAKFSDFMEGKVDAAPGRKATIADWENHLNTIWPEVRLRGFLEMRGADNGPAEMIKALPALWVGLLYDKKALDQAYEMVRDWTNEDREYLRAETPRTGLQTPFMGTTVQEIAKNMLAISEAGLKRRAITDGNGNDESVYLEPLHEIANTGKNWAVRLIESFYGRWGGKIEKLFEEQSYEKHPSVLKAAPAPAAAPLHDRKPNNGIPFKKTG
jgi:glutamate--cysteine ligase